MKVEKLKYYRAQVNYENPLNVKDDAPKNGSIVLVNYVWDGDDDSMFPGEACFQMAEYSYWLPLRDLNILEEVSFNDFFKAMPSIVKSKTQSEAEAWYRRKYPNVKPKLSHMDMEIIQLLEEYSEVVVQKRNQFILLTDCSLLIASYNRDYVNVKDVYGDTHHIEIYRNSPLNIKLSQFVVKGHNENWFYLLTPKK